MARRTQAQLAATREAIIQSATQLFAEKGFASTQVAEIAAGAEVGMSAFYGQFQDKETLFLHIVQNMFTQMHQRIIAVRSTLDLQATTDALLNIQQTYQITFDSLNQHRQIMLSIFRSGMGSMTQLEALYWQVCDTVARDMSKDIQRAEDAGLLHIANHRDYSDAMIGMINQLACRMIVDGAPTPSEAAHTCTMFTLGALLLNMPQAVLTTVLPLLVLPTASSLPR